MSKSKIRETQNEIENLQAIDQGVRFRYREIMESLRSDLLTNEKECKKLQERIEWVSRRRAEIREEVKGRLKKLFSVAIAKKPQQPPLNAPDSKQHRLKNKLAKTHVVSISPKVSKDIPLITIMPQKDIPDNVSTINYSTDATKNKIKDKREVPRKGGGNKTDQSRPPYYKPSAYSNTRPYYGAFRH